MTRKTQSSTASQSACSIRLKRSRHDAICGGGMSSVSHCCTARAKDYRRSNPNLECASAESSQRLREMRAKHSSRPLKPDQLGVRVFTRHAGRAVSSAVSFSRHSVDLRVRCYDTDAHYLA